MSLPQFRSKYRHYSHWRGRQCCHQCRGAHLPGRADGQARGRYHRIVHLCDRPGRSQGHRLTRRRQVAAQNQVRARPVVVNFTPPDELTTPAVVKGCASVKLNRPLVVLLNGPKVPTELPCIRLAPPTELPVNVPAVIPPPDCSVSVPAVVSVTTPVPAFTKPVVFSACPFVSVKFPLLPPGCRRKGAEICHHIARLGKRCVPRGTSGQRSGRDRGGRLLDDCPRRGQRDHVTRCREVAAQGQVDPPLTVTRLMSEVALTPIS